jgi:hypothetical protein
MPSGYEGSEIVDPERARALINELLTSADVVIVAAPPVQAGPAALSWARAVDGTVLVARRDHARREDAEAAAETLVHVGGNLIGAIIAERPAPLSGLFGRGRSTRPVAPPPRGTPMASPMSPASATSSASTSSPYRPASPPPQVMPSAIRPTVVRASAPAAPPPSEAESPAERPVRSTNGRPRSTGKSGTPRNRPTDAR